LLWYRFSRNIFFFAKIPWRYMKISYSAKAASKSHVLGGNP
jgi:hypothetical protein